MTIKPHLTAALLAATLHAAPAVAAPADCSAAAAYSTQRDGVSLLVWRDGTVICEDYPAGSTADMRHPLASGTKSFTGIMAAAAAQDGFLSLDEHVADTITEWKADPLKAQVTVRQLIGLISGMTGAAIGNVPTYADAVATPITIPPGTVFHYGPSPFQVFGELMKRKLAARGGDADPLHYLKRRILDPLGIDPGDWRRGADGNPNMPSGASLTARQWVLVGEFMLAGGKWQGKQLVDPATLAQLTRSGPVNPSYGISWWLEGKLGTSSSPDKVSATVDLTGHASELPAGIYLAAGAGIQRLYVIPSAHMVVVRQATLVPRAERRAVRRQAAREPAGDMAVGDSRWSDAAFLKLIPGIR